MFFGYGYSGHNQTSPTSPTRTSVWGSAFSPFRNTNMPLQDITMSQTLPVMKGNQAKSPGKLPSPGGTGMSGTGGRTMKEYEDQLGTLKKENFNLKLRIYFLEERMGITSPDEDAVKKNIELKVENESLREELIEKQKLLNQAAKAFELIEEQKEASSRNQLQYEQSLEKERERIAQLEKELEEYREKMTESSVYYKEAFGITPDRVLEHEEKLHQMEELVASLEAEVQQRTASLEEERNWAQELASERDQFKDRLQSEIRVRETLISERDRDIEELRTKVRELEEQVLKRESIVQQYKHDVAEKDRLVKEKSVLLEEKCRAYEELGVVSEKRKKQIDQLRNSVKSRDDALTDLNNKNRALLSQFENSYTKRCSPPSSPSTMNSFDDTRSPRMGHKSSCIHSPPKLGSSPVDWEPNRERSLRVRSPIPLNGAEYNDITELSKQVDEKDRELKRQEQEKKQLMLKLCNARKASETTEQKLKDVEMNYTNALKAIKELVERQRESKEIHAEKDRKILDLEAELSQLRGTEHFKEGRVVRSSSVRRNLASEMTDDPERDHSNQRRFEEMETKINDLRDQIETIRAEKIKLEMQIQVESEELQQQLQDEEQKVIRLETERNDAKKELEEKIAELDKLREAYDRESAEVKDTISRVLEEREKLHCEMCQKNAELERKNQRIVELNRDLQKLVNTELWNKNKEIAKFQDHLTASNNHERSRNRSDSLQESAASQLASLIQELNSIGVTVKFTDDVVQLNHIGGKEPVDVKTMTTYIQKLVVQKNELENEVDYLKWLKVITKPDISGDIGGFENETERAKKCCEVLRTHLKDLMNFMKDMLKGAEYSDGISNEHRRIVLDVLVSSKLVTDDFVHALEGKMGKMACGDNNGCVEDNVEDLAKKCYSENVLDGKVPISAQSDSEAFSEPDRTVSLARIGLQETQNKSIGKSRHSKYTKTFSDSEDSVEFVPCHKTYQSDLNDGDIGHLIQDLMETNELLCKKLDALRSEFLTRSTFDDAFEGKFKSFIASLEKSQRSYEKVQSSIEKKLHECHTLKREGRQNSIRRAQLEKKLADVEVVAAEMTKQKAELHQYKENAERKAAEMLMALNKENEMLRAKIRKLEEEQEQAKATLSALTKELDRLTLSHSQVLVENTKLTNDKLRLEQEMRKIGSRCDMLSVCSHNDKLKKEVLELNLMNDSHRARIQELEMINKELQRQVVVCETSDSAPSSSGISSIPIDGTLKQNCDDIQDYHNYNGFNYWQLMNYPTSTGRSKSNCSPDLGIESDAAVTTTRPLKDTLKITQSITNLLSDEENCNGKRELRDLDSESPLPIEGMDEVKMLKQENKALKRKVQKTRKALKNTFQQLSESNKNKKDVEKAITKQLTITKNILMKTRTYENAFDN
ncbi:centrosomin isoform X2 [Orussus abietinus]|uniref:centrosomin isoform X2 n=1 Tax=Orussus abietinus TaxID=222816 RepID=UPI0006251062|nr:centrosomin isoform X2 [Orussus abietinus]